MAEFTEETLRLLAQPLLREHGRALVELFDALLADYVEAAEHIGLSRFEERSQWWQDLRGIASTHNQGEHQ
jgi:hypothetical protein